MRCTNLFLIAFSFCFINLSLAVTIAQAKDPCGRPWSTPLFTVSGKIVDVYYATPPWTNEEGLHLEIKTPSDSSVVIHVFPKSCIDNNSADKFRFSVGENITTTGSQFYSEGGAQRNICAAEIEQRPDLALRNLQTGCLNDELCHNCQGFCEDLCASRTNFDLCINTCLGNCQSTIIPCPAGTDSDKLTLPTSTYFLLLNNL